MTRLGFRGIYTAQHHHTERDYYSEGRQMRGYIVRRLLLLIPNIFILATIIFFLVRVAPGDAAQTLTSEDGRILSQEALDQTREALGLNDPVFVQY